MLMRQAAFLATLLFAAQAWAQGAPSLSTTRPRHVDVRWEASPAATRGYEVWRRDADAERWTRLATSPADARSFADRTVLPRASYVYRVDGLGEGKVTGAPSRPVQALDAFYLEVQSLGTGSARLVVHRWDVGFGEWLRSDPYDVKVGDPIGKQGMIADFRTGATLVHAGADAIDASVHVVRYKTRDGRELSVSSRTALPKAVLKKKVEKKKPKETPAGTTTRADKAKETTSEPEKPEPIKFPEPTRVGEAPGKKVVWEIINSSDVVMNVLILTERGGKRAFKLREAGSYTSKFKRGGKVTVSAVADDKDVRPLRGEFSLVPGSKYRSELKIRFGPREDR